ncbi:gluconokinase [Devosia sp. YIM 151766]|uniref:gluconokinase n=1 Tax=Devosia sp. YIM 151766 TaxID=3017325 RepID=UPI00255C5E7C|nr:gluconokinase [Devosia sp. YIM 151766]WIY51596.1 gluconokinase [Devosia sp. YIM 151766]
MSTAPSQPQSEPARIIIVMGVSSSGKSTIGAALSRALHAPFLDGDQYHPEANVEKMRAGTPLTDADRWPWLEVHAAALKQASQKKGVAVGASSALKKAYRDFITEQAGEPVLFVYLDGSQEVIAERMAKRSHEYMPTSLLDSQFATLEVPDPETENVLAVPVTDSVDKIVRTVVGSLDHLKSFKRWQ